LLYYLYRLIKYIILHHACSSTDALTYTTHKTHNTKTTAQHKKMSTRSLGYYLKIGVASFVIGAFTEVILIRSGYNQILEDSHRKKIEEAIAQEEVIKERMKQKYGDNTNISNQ